jgi:predicted transcriptional regulator
VGAITGVRSEERLIPIIRAALAEKLAAEGFHVKEIAAALNVTPAAVTQYLKRKRGTNILSVGRIDHLIAPLAEKVAKGVRAGTGGIKTVELLETARQAWSSTPVDRSSQESRRSPRGTSRSNC